MARGFRQLKETFGHIRKLRVTGRFLLAYWLYIDGVDTIIRMAVDYGINIGLPSDALITALLITQFVGFPAAIVFGKLGEKLGPKPSIFAAIAVYIGVTVGAVFMREAWHFYALAAVIGLVQGGVQALSRSFYARIIPPSRASEFFGFYNMLGKFAAVLGPAMVAVSAQLVGGKYSILVLLVLFVSGGWLLRRVDPSEGARLAAQLDAESMESGQA